tara:strand:- start:341 stop:673 length:333 start_codon:yes stop_codon:yes gene_type:complete
MHRVFKITKDDPILKNKSFVMINNIFLQSNQTPRMTNFSPLTVLSPYHSIELILILSLELIISTNSVIKISDIIEGRAKELNIDKNLIQLDNFKNGILYKNSVQFNEFFN